MCSSCMTKLTYVVALTRLSMATTTASMTNKTVKERQTQWHQEEQAHDIM